MTELQIVYVLLRFPRLTETFVAEEIRAIRAKGVDLRIFSLLRSQDDVTHPLSQELMQYVRYAPSLLSGSLWLAQAYYLARAPAKYLGLLKAILGQRAPRLSFYGKRIDVFLKGAWIARQLEHRNIDLVHTHFAWLSAVAGMMVGRLLDIPFTFSAHAYDIYSEKSDLLKLASGASEGIVTISEANRGAIVAANPGLPAAKPKVIRCGIDLDYFSRPAIRPANPVLQITSVGRLLPKKGHEYLLRACAELTAQGLDFQCVIIGGGELQKSLESLIGTLQLGGKVSLAGPRSQDWVRDRLRLSDVFVLACVTDNGGDQDGIPVSIMEAMAVGVPVVSTAVSGIPELVRNEETGLLVAERNTSALASAMLRLARDEPLRSRIIQKAHDLVSSEYDIQRNASQLWCFFEDTIQARAARTGTSA